MTRSLCNSCGLRSRYCQCGDEQASTALNANGERAYKLGNVSVSFCVCYLITLAMMVLFSIGYMSLIILFPDKPPCYLEVFADSFSVSNASNANATADWNIGFTTKSKTCEASLHTIISRLFHGNKLISGSSTPDSLRLIASGTVNEIPFPHAVFKTVKTPRSGVVWDLRVEVISSTKIYDRDGYRDGFLTMSCEGIPVNFTVDSTGDVKGSLLGLMRPCDYQFRKEFSHIVSWL